MGNYQIKMHYLDLSWLVLLSRGDFWKKVFSRLKLRNSGTLPPKPILESPDKSDYWLMLCGLPAPGANAACLPRGKPADHWPCQTLLGSWRSRGNRLSWQRLRSGHVPICQGFCKRSPAWRPAGGVGEGCLHSHHYLSPHTQSVLRFGFAYCSS